MIKFVYILKNGKVIERPERQYPYSFSLHCKWVADEKDL